MGYVLDTGEVRHAWREGQDQWKVSRVSTSADSFSNTAVSGSISIAYTYRQDGTDYAAQAVNDRLGHGNLQRWAKEMCFLGAF